MKNTINKQTETLKKNIVDVSKKSKEGIKTLIDTNSKQFQTAIKANTKTFDAIGKMLYENEMVPSVVKMFKSAFSKAITLSEGAIDSIIDSYNERMDLSINFTSKFLDAMKNENLSTKAGVEKLVNLVKENLEKSAELSVSNMEKVSSVYNDHVNFALNFNQKLADSINTHLTAMFRMQKKNLDATELLHMVTEWWKNTEEEKVPA